MKKKLHFPILTILLIVIVIAALYLIPRIKHFDVTLDAVKLDNNKTVVGHVTFRIQGDFLDYLFLKDRVDASISSFDGLQNFQFSEVNGVIGGFELSKDQTYIHTFCSCTKGGYPGPLFADLAFSQDMEKWIFRNASQKEYYVASASGKVSTDELIDFFSDLFFSPCPAAGC